VSIEQQQQDEERRRAEEEAIAASNRDAAADYYTRRDLDHRIYGHGGRDYSVDGRPLMVRSASGWITYEQAMKEQS